MHRETKSNIYKCITTRYIHCAEKNMHTYILIILNYTHFHKEIYKHTINERMLRINMPKDHTNTDDTIH